MCMFGRNGAPGDGLRVIINETSNFRLSEKMSNFSDFRTSDVEKSENEAATFFGPGFVFREVEIKVRKVEIKV